MTFDYLKPGSLTETVQILDHHGDRSKLLAGGTALTLLLQNRLIAPDVLVDLSDVPGLDAIAVDAEGLHLGPMVTLHRVSSDSEIQKSWPGLSDACAEVGNVRVRHQATIGGNLAEADYASDPPAMLLALDASLSILGPRGSRSMTLADFFLGFYTTALNPDDVITDILVPSPPQGCRMIYLKYKTRSSEDRPCVGVAAVAEISGGVCRGLRLAVGAACDVPTRVAELEAQARDRELDDATIEDLAAAYADQIDTLEDLRGSAWYRKEMIRVHVRRALEAVRDGHR